MLNPVRGKQLLNQLSPGNTAGRSHELGYRAKPAKTERQRHELDLRANRPGAGESSWPERGSGFPGASLGKKIQALEIMDEGITAENKEN